MTYIQINPGSFVSPPFAKCPKCGKDKFGILDIYGDHYTRRCKDCWYPNGNEASESYPLPELKKTIIYIDQFAISNMMKALNPRTKAYQKGQIDKIWLRMFERLDSLCKLQLIVCPDSDFHRNESYLSPFYPALQRMYELLSHSLSFYDYKTIQRIQLCQQCLKWLEGRGSEPIEVKIESVTHGEINKWQNRLIVSTNMKIDEKMIEEMRIDKEKTCDELQKCVDIWKTETGKEFNYWYEGEWHAYGLCIIRDLSNYLSKYARVVQGVETPNLDNIMLPESCEIIPIIQHVFKDKELTEEAAMKKAFEFIQSDSLQNVPFIKISAMLWAAIARKYATGRTSALSKGTANDVDIISVLLPYCDAMFIDRESHGYLRENPLSEEINYGTRIYSLSNKVEFFEYLDKIEASATEEHLAAVREVYGDSWKKPYLTLYKN